MNISQFRQFCLTRFPLEAGIRHLTDGRRRPQIPVASIVWALVYGGVLGLGSLLGLDQFLRTPSGRRLFGRSRPLVSDSTLARSWAGLALAPVHALLQAVYAVGRTLGLGRCPVGQGRWRIGLLDGSTFGGLSASCFAEVGAITVLGDLAVIPTRGQELPTSEALLRTLCQRFGRRWVDLLLLDGLYVAQGFVRTCLDDCGVDVLIKTQESGLTILQDAMGLLAHPQAARFGVELAQGVDRVRLRTYEVRALGGFPLTGVAAPFKVAWVRETDLRTGQTYEFWVLPTRQSLSADEMRELAHWRWDIENNGFKTLNALVHTKHLSAHAPQAAEAMLLLLFLAGNLLQLFWAQVDPARLTALLGRVKHTRRLGQQLLRESLATPPALDTS